MLAAEEGAVDAHGKLCPVLRVGLAFDGAGQHDAGVVDQNVQGAAFVLDFADNRLPARLVSDILALEDRANVVRHRLTGFLIDIGQHHPRPFSGECPRIGFTEALGAPCNQRDLS